MLLEELLRKHLPLGSDDLADVMPAEIMSRQDWQDGIETLVEDIRKLTRKPAYGLSETEISVHFHLPLKRLMSLLESRLGIAKPG